MRALRRLALMLAMVPLSSAAPAQMWSVTGDGNPANNPNGVWSYGTISLGGLFTPFTSYDTAFGLPLARWTHYGYWVDPNVIFNTSTSTFYTHSGSIIWPGRSLHLHPWADGTRAAVRFTAPAAGSYRADAFFEARNLWWTTTDVHVGVNNTVVFNGNISRPLGMLWASYSSGGFDFTLNAGDTIDFYVGIGPDHYFSDSTGLWASVERQRDTTLPTLTAASDPSQLWPPNGKLVPVTVTGALMDSGSGPASQVSYTVIDEYGQIQPSGMASVGAGGAFSFTVDLEAARSGEDRDGRLYTIVITGRDLAGNTSTVTVTVVVPHDQR